MDRLTYFKHAQGFPLLASFGNKDHRWSEKVLLVESSRGCNFEVPEGKPHGLTKTKRLSSGDLAIKHAIKAPLLGVEGEQIRSYNWKAIVGDEVLSQSLGFHPLNLRE